MNAAASPPPRERDRSVFLNCPFDGPYRPLLDALVFTCVRAGFHPLPAPSTGRSGTPRLDRILKALEDCRYSIHDLSRSHGEGDQNLARFNMPLELGMAMATRGRAPGDDAHEYLVLVRDAAGPHHRYISDLGGLDPQAYDGTVERLVAELLKWLLDLPGAVTSLRPSEVVEALPRFDAARRELETQWYGAGGRWIDLIEVAAAVPLR